MTVQNINHMNLIVRDLEQGRAFAEGFLELRPHPTFTGAYILGPGDPLLVMLEFPRARLPDLRTNPHHRHRSITLAVESLPALRDRALACGLSASVVLPQGPEISAQDASESELREMVSLDVRDADQNLWRFVAA